MEKNIKNDIHRSVQSILTNLDVFKDKSILITGGTGFMGSWVARTLAYLNDQFSFKCHILLLARSTEKLERIDPELLNRDDVTFINSDIRSLHGVPNNINYIIHAAGTPDNRIHMSDPVNTMDTIAVGTKSVLDMASRLDNIEGIVYISSGQVYNDVSSDREGVDEGGWGELMTSIYPEAKRYAEAICLAYQCQYKLPIKVVRAFSFIGPFQELNKPWAINSFMQEALNKQDMRVMGNGKPQRSYLYASDMAAWLLVLLAKGKVGGVYDLGSSHGVSILDVTNKINEVLIPPVDVLIQNKNDDDSKFLPNMEYIKSSFNLTENFTFDEAIRHTIEWNLKYQESQRSVR